MILICELAKGEMHHIKHKSGMTVMEAFIAAGIPTKTFSPSWLGFVSPKFQVRLNASPITNFTTELREDDVILIIRHVVDKELK